MSAVAEAVRRRTSGGNGRLVGVLMGLGYGGGWAIGAVWLGRFMPTCGLSSSGVMFWRALLIAGMMLAVLLARGRAAGDVWRGLRVQRKHVLLLAVFGLLGITLNTGAWGMSITLNGVTVATVMAYSAPIFTVLLSRPIYGERITGRKALSLVMALTGCLLVSQVYDMDGSSLTTFGLAVALAVGIFQSGRDLMGKTMGHLYPEMTNLFYAFLFGAVFLGIVQLSPALVPHMPLSGWLQLGGIALIVMVSYLLYLGALARLPVSVASILGLSEPVVAAILAYFILGETLSSVQTLGAAMVIGGVLVLEVRDA